MNSYQMTNLNYLIKKITPLHNFYKSSMYITGTEALTVMWNIGDHLKHYIDDNSIPPHKLYRQIYGKSEGRENIQQRSYIAREFLGRCYRVRRIFTDKAQIKKELPKLKTVNNFREAMPFFDNVKYKLEFKDRQGLLNLLNSNLEPKVILKKIRSLQKSIIQKSNPRTQRLSELEEDKETFIKFYNHIYQLFKSNSYKRVKNERVDPEYIKLLSKNTSALSQDGLKYFEFEVIEKPSIWREYGSLVRMFISQNDATLIRRFRRLIPPQRMLTLSEMLFALSGQDRYKKFLIR